MGVKFIVGRNVYLSVIYCFLDIMELYVEILDFKVLVVKFVIECVDLLCYNNVNIN